MNIFGSFSFGKIIKTFLPGFVIFISIYGIIDAILLLCKPEYYPMKLLSQRALFAGFMIIPVSIILGIISNIAFYTHFTDRYVRNTFKKENATLLDIETNFRRALIKQISSENPLSEKAVEHFNEIDILYFLMPILPLEKLIFLQEGYWYYLEFIQNLVLSIIIFGLSMIFYISIFYVKMPFSPIPIIMITLFLLIMCPILKLLRKAALKNYKSHRVKLLSMQIGAVHFHRGEK